MRVRLADVDFAAQQGVICLTGFDVDWYKTAVEDWKYLGSPARTMLNLAKHNVRGRKVGHPGNLISSLIGL